MYIKNLLLGSLCVLILAGCSLNTFQTIPNNVSQIDSQTKLVFDDDLKTKWVVSEKYQASSVDDNNDFSNSYFIQYRGMLDKNNKMKYVKLYISDYAYNNLGDINEIVGSDKQYFNFKLFKKDCFENENIVEKTLPLEESKYGKHVKKIVTCEVDTLSKVINETKDLLKFEHNRVLISIPFNKLKELSSIDYVLELRYKSRKYKILIPKQFSENMLRQYFKYQGPITPTIIY